MNFLSRLRPVSSMPHKQAGPFLQAVAGQLNDFRWLPIRTYKLRSSQVQPAGLTQWLDFAQQRGQKLSNRGMNRQGIA